MRADPSFDHLKRPTNLNDFMFTRVLHQEGSEEGESPNTTGGGPATKKSKTVAAAADTSVDEATIEVVRRPRGRPPGSKNKPKPPPLLATPDADQCSMRPLVLEIPGGADVVNAVFGFAKRRNVGLCVLAASGTVTNVSLRQPSSTSVGEGGAIVTFHGRFDILSVSATFIPPSSSSSSLLSTLPSMTTNSFTISLAGPQGQIIGGSVAGALAAVGTVFLVAASFDAHSYYRLPIEELPDAVSPTVVLDAGEESHGHHGHQSITLKSVQSRGMPAYSCQLVPSDIVWASTSRSHF